MSRFKWTVGMAVYETGDGGYESMRAAFTAMSLTIHHPFIGEVIIVDNNPQPFSPMKAFMRKVKNCRYVEMPGLEGTSAPRNRIFTEAKHEFVACLDPHVLLYPGTFEAMMGFYARVGHECPDLLHGTLMTEGGKVLGTHMNDQWRSQMLGTWGVAYQSSTGRLFSVLTRDDKKAEYVSIGQEEGEQRPLTLPEIEALKVPVDLDWPGHETKLVAAGCTLPTSAFPVPGHGMGFFACRKEAWLPFHPAARGFGGEEITTGYRFRQAGRRCWSVPGVKWWHHFDKGPYRSGVAYPIRLCDRVRNYVLEFCRLGLDLTPIRDHFEAQVPAHEWPALLNGDYLPDANAMPSSVVASEIEPAVSLT